jgi:hypothetical protein
MCIPNFNDTPNTHLEESQCHSFIIHRQNSFSGCERREKGSHIICLKISLIESVRWGKKWVMNMIKVHNMWIPYF